MLAAVLSVGGADAFVGVFPDVRRSSASPGQPRLSDGPSPKWRRAILHDRELTYSLAAPQRHPLVANRLQTYRLVHESLIAALGQWGIEAKFCTPHAPREEDALTRSVSSRTAEPFLCFQRRSPGDVLLGGQNRRKCPATMPWGRLQHGSLLLARSAAAPELDGLKELSGRAILVEEVIQAWVGKAWPSRST